MSAPAEAPRFDSEQVADWLGRRGLRAVRAANGMLVVPLPAEDPTEDELEAWIAKVGEGGRVLTVQVRSPVRVGRDTWPDALVSINGWNARTRMPKAWLAVDDWESSGDAGVVLEGVVSIEDGLGQSAFDHLADAVVVGARGFWKWVTLHQSW